MPIDAKAPDKILVVRIGAAGDMVMITPALRAILDHFPDSEVALLTSADGKRMLTGFDARVRTFHLCNRKDPLYFWHKHRTLREVRSGNYGAVFCFENNPKIQNFFKDYSCPKYMLRKARGHSSQQLLDAVMEALGGRVTLNRDNYPLHLPVSTQAKAEMTEYLRTQGIDDDTFLIGLHPTFSGIDNPWQRLKRGRHHIWPAEYFGRLGKMLAMHGHVQGRPVQVVANLLPSEQKIGQAVREASNGALRLLIPPPNIERYKAYLQRCDLLVVPNTGPMHMAAAVGTPVVALYSSQSVEDNAPFTAFERFSVLRAEDTSQPHLGLAAITPEAVFETCLSQIQKSAKNNPR